MAIKKSTYWIAGAYLFVFMLAGIYMAHQDHEDLVAAGMGSYEHRLDKAQNDSNKATIPQLSGSTDSTMTDPLHEDTAPAMQVDTTHVDLPAVTQQNWKHAEFCTGGEGLGSRLVVDGRAVETRSSDLRQVWYAPGWDAKRVDETLDKIRQDGGGNTTCALTSVNKAAL